MKFSPESLASMLLIQECFKKAEIEFAKLSDVERDSCLDFHTENQSLNHFMRWGSSCVSELIDSHKIAKAFTALRRPDFAAMESQLVFNGYFIGARHPLVRPDFAGTFMVAESNNNGAFDMFDNNDFAIVGDDKNELILEAFQHLID